MKIRRFQLPALIAAVAFSITTAMAAPDREAEKPAPPKYVGVLLSNVMVERRNPLDFFSTGQPTLHEIVRTIDRAAVDKRVKGLVVRVEFPSFGMAQAMEIQAALARFRATGKPVYATSDALDIVSYVTISPSTQIAMPPVSALDLRGIAFSLYYFRSMLQKVGIQAEVVNAGDYKDALDPLLRDEMTPQTREQMNALMQDVYTSWVDSVAQHREVAPAIAKELLQSGPHTPSRALEKGLIDAIGYPDDIVEEWIGEDSELDWEYAPTARRTPKPPSLFELFAAPTPATKRRAASTKKSVAVVYLMGPIIDGRADTSNPFAVEEVIASEDAIDLLREAREDDNVAAMVLRVSSPGGSAIASDRIWAEIDMIREEGIPVVVSMGDVAASGGYYISCGADHVFAEPTTITGSIGVIGGKLNMSSLYTTVGINRQTLSIGPNADLFSETTPWTGESKAAMDLLLSDIYTSFLQRVSDGREMPVEDVRKLAGGRVWSGMAAEKNGLVDELGGLHAAIEKARELGEVPNAPIVEFPRELTPMELLEELFSGGLGVRTVTPHTRQSLLLNELLATVSPNVAAQVRGTMLVMGQDYRVLAYAPIVLSVD